MADRLRSVATNLASSAGGVDLGKLELGNDEPDLTIECMQHTPEP
jgi:hypothetical protein